MSPSMRIVSYNIHGGVGTDRRFAPERVAEVIVSLDADVVGLQEVDSRSFPGGPTSLSDFLARKANLTPVFVATMKGPSGQYGNALLTRFPVVTVRRHDLSLRGREPRAALDVDLDADGTVIRVLVTHLGLRRRERRVQLDRLLGVLARHQQRPLFLLGDFNDWWSLGTTTRRLRVAFGRTPTARTYPSRFPLVALDRIYARPAHALGRVFAHGDGPSRLASDHLPLVATCEPSSP